MSSQQDDSALDAASLFRLDGLVALVTGGGTGIGLMLAKALAKNGAAKVYIAGRRLEVLQAAASSTGPNVIPVQCDVTSKESLASVVKHIEDDAGYLNLLVCNSGIGGPQVTPIKPETSLEEWADSNFALEMKDYVNTFTVNSASVWFTCMAFLKLLDKGNKKGNLQQSSQIVVTSSIAAFNKKAPGGWAYGQSKAAATLAVKQLAVALPQWNIRANCIAPGLFPSEMSEPIVKLFAGDSGEPGALPAEMVPIRRMGDEKDMGGTMLYLASRAGAYCNGAVILVDGGRLGNFPAAN
ncbi:Short-chain dehydrogenase/reductase VdtF [Paramyrothecium foliicola]|nr:Short-chain dehydrogenase/reductase VdtF [Paramyrothecium foliicola]